MSKTTVELLLTRVEVLERAVERLERKIEAQAEYLSSMVPTHRHAEPATQDRASHFMRWALETFGGIALNPHERTMRFVEEAIELAHAMGLAGNDVGAITARVYARPAGDPAREAGQCLAVFECLMRVAGIDADQEATAELARVKAIPKEEWTSRHAAKVAIGIAQA